jgi:NitT/TauT family transport system substrate-binding protein
MKANFSGFTRTLAATAVVGGLLLTSPWQGHALAQATGQSLTSVTLSLDFIVLGRFAPWYVAQAKGYYKEAGLDVKIVPSQGTAQSVQALEAGIAQFALSDLAGQATTRAQGTSTAHMVAIFYQNAPYTIYSLKSGANVTQPKQLEGLEIASGAGSATPKVILGFMRAKGLDTSNVKFTNVEGSARVPLLLSGKIPAIETFILAKPGIERAAGTDKVATFLLADHGLQLYSGGILVTEAYLKSNPAIVKAFVQASMKGWRDAMANPQEAAKLMNAQVPTISTEAIVAELEIVRGLAVTEDVKAKGFGTLDPKKFEDGVNFLAKNMEIPTNKLPLKSMYSVDYLPNPPIKP